MFKIWKVQISSIVINAGYDFEHFKKSCGIPLDGNIPPLPKKLNLLDEKTEYEAMELPDTFDARQKWPNCKSTRSIGEIGDQEVIRHLKLWRP